MGFIDFLKKLVSNAEEGLKNEKKPGEEVIETPESIDLRADELINFISKHESEFKNNLKHSEKEFYSKLFSCKAELKNLSEELKKVDLSKRRDPEKIKFVVNQNRESYLAFISIFLLDIEKIDKDEEIGNNLERIRKSFDNFTRQSTRNYYIINELIGKELINITHKLKEISDLIKEFLNNNSELIKKLKEISNLKEDVKRLIEKKYFIEEVVKNKISIEREKYELENKKLEIKKDIKNIRESEEFKQHISLKEEIKDKEKEINEIRYSISAKINFKILEKYAHDSPGIEKIIEKIKANSLELLDLADEEQFLRVIKETTDFVNSGKIVVKEEQKEKIILSLQEIDKERIQSWKKEYKVLLVKISELKEKERPLDINSKERDSERILLDIEKLDKEIKEDEDKKEKISERIKEEREEIEKNIKRILEKNVKLI